MRSHMKTLVAVMAALLVAPLALAEPTDEQLQAMNERLAELENRLQMARDQLDDSKGKVEHQQELLQKAGVTREAQSGLSAFLSETQFSGFLASSWTYNFTRPDASSMGANAGTSNGENLGSMGLTAPHHSNHNTFQVDQFFLSMIKPATAESRGGWGAELVWGANADSQNFGSGFGKSFNGDGNTSHLYQAYVEYLADVGSGLNIKAGRFETPIGAETFRADRNWQVTRGLLWALQPVNHTGLIFAGQCECGIDWSAGVVNSFSSTMTDRDNEKTVVGHVGYTAETYSFRVNGLYGGDASDTWLTQPILSGFNSFINGPGTNKDKVGLIDVVATWDPREDFSAWVNFDYWWTDNPQNSPATTPISSMTIYGVAAAARLAVTEATGLSIRYEWLYFNDIDLVFIGDNFGPNTMTNPPFVNNVFAQSGADARMWSLTGTVDHALTDNLTLKAEARWDQGWAQGTNDRFFVRRTDEMLNQPIYSKENQVLGVLQMMYRF